jgi:amino acid adenylation domain-containing protein
MKTIEEFLSDLRCLDVKLWADGDRLRYSTPKGTLTPVLRAQLAERKAEILTFLHKANLTSSPALEPIQPIPREGDLPLSFGQQRLWFLDQLEGGSATYNEFFALNVNGSLQITALEQTLTEMVRRHEILRTTFPMRNGIPVQAIAPTQPVPLPMVDLQQLLEVEQAAEVRRLAIEEQTRPFDLSNDPLLRATLLRLAEESYVLLLNMHHIVCDGWSMGIFIRELSALYEAFSKGALSPLPELPIQYADFAHWQRQWLQGEVLAAHLAYWRQQLAGAPPVLELPTDRPRSAVQTFRGATQFLALPKPLSQKLKVLSQRWGVTLFMTLLAAFQTLLYRYTGHSNICVGTPIANRNRSEIEGLIGFFVNTLVLHTDLSGNPSFPELLGRVRQVALGAYAHQDLPFEQLVEVLQPDRSLSHQPLFQVMFVVHDALMTTLELSGVTLSSLEMDSETAKFDLTLSIADGEQGLMGSLEYNTDLFETATITRMLGHFQTLLEGIVANPEQRLSDLPLLTQAERHTLLVEWNDTEVDYPKDICIHQLFEAQVERTPDAIAVVFEDKQLTYRELNRRANQLAHHLRSLGIGPEALVGICVERSLEMVVGLLGILKAGGAYVPLDPAYPQERLTFMLEDSQVPVLLTQLQLVEKLPEHQARVICLDADWDTITSNREENAISGVTPENLTYVIYTSGSTGKPKGTMLSHRALCNHMLWMSVTWPLNQTDRVLQKTAISFDASVWEFYAPLIAGAQLIMARPEGHKDSVYLVEAIAEHKVTVLQLVPSMLQVLLSLPQLDQCDCLQRVYCGGEALSIELQQRFGTRLGAELYNLYGPTEACIDSTWWACEPESKWRTVPIGRPIANTEIYLLDLCLQMVPIGVPGELYIGGAGLARGYLNRPELTAERFIPNPFSQEPGTRLYKTGDLARYLPDGNIEYLGRLDDQVKIRGFRIELAEIEAVLRQHPHILQTVVITREDSPGEKHLVAYWVANPERVPSISELRNFLKQQLPDYMIPGAFVSLDALPLMPNGKVDRRALPAPDTTKPELEKAFVAPRDPLELQLAHIWEDLLGVRPIGVTDNFFNLGGHSILAVRLMAQIQQQFGQNLPLTTLFQAATIEQLANTLRQPTASLPWSPLVEIQPGGSKWPIFCMPGGGGNVIYLYHLARHLGSDQPFYGLQARGLDGEQAPHTQVEDIAAYNIEAMQSVQPQGPYLLAGHSFGSYVAFEMAAQLLEQGQEVALLAILDTQAPVPGDIPVEVDLDDAEYLSLIAISIERFFGKSLSVSYEELQPLDPDERLNYLLERLKMINFFPPEAKPSQIRGFLQVAKANDQAYYVPKGVYRNRITLFRASEEFRDAPAMGWDKFSSELVETHDVPGDHVTMVTEPHVQVLAKKLRACLDKAQADDERK